jgi:phosphatidate cytidylyltransferase|tara:strand:- start:59 stop:709 length:651 start_codon:yes stop_codon:yes gene_type:complete
MISKNLKQRIFTSVLLLSVVFLFFNFIQISVLGVLILGVLSVLELLNIAKKIFKNRLYKLFFSLSFIIYIFLFCLLFLYFLNIYELKIIIFSILFGCIASDIGGFVFGKLFKGPKLSKISPNKTISGSIGSFIFTCVATSSSIFYFTKYFSYTLLVVCFFITAACQLGDLFFSFLKRKAKIKDTGNLLPGHGGILDRLDGIFFGVPVGILVLILFY